MNGRDEDAWSAAGDPMIDLALAQLFRSECADCGWSVLRWFVGADAIAILGLAASAELLRSIPVADRAAAECWQCSRCGASGAFGPVEWETF